MKNIFFAAALVLAISSTSVVSAATVVGAEGDGRASLSYDSETGSFSILPDGNTIGLLELKSESGIFTGSDAVLPGNSLFTEDLDNSIGFAQLAGDVTDILNLGPIASPGLEFGFLLQDLTITFSGGFGTPNVEGDLIGIPEPTTFALLGLALVGFAGLRRRS